MAERIRIIGFMVALVATLLFGNYYETHYWLQGEVFEKNEDSITLEDSRGILWECYTENSELNVGDAVKICFFDSRSTRINDDEVESFKYIG